MNRKMKITVITTFFLILSFSCASRYELYYRSLFDRKIDVSFDVVSGKSGPEVKEVINIAYGADFDYDDLYDLVQKTVQKYPDNGNLHEVAAFLALLGSDSRSYFAHLVKAASDINCRFAETYIRLLNSMELTYRKEKIYKRLLSELIQKHPDMRIRNLSRSILLERSVLQKEIDKAQMLAEQSGVIDKWMLIGAFDNDNGKGYYEVYPPERKIDFSGSYRGKVTEVNWRKIKGIDKLGHVPLDEFIYPSNDSVAYLYTSAYSPEKKEVIFSISTGDSIKMWINGSEVVSKENIESFGYDNILVKTVLNKGPNPILIKSAQRSGDWIVGVKIFDLDGNYKDDLIFSFDKTDIQHKDTRHVMMFPFKMDSHEKADVRHDLLNGILLETSGHVKAAKDFYLRAFEKTPMNLFSKLFAAEAYKAAGEEGKYIDVLNLAILKTNYSVPAFINRRGEFYSIKNQQERAEEDFKRVLELNPLSYAGSLNLARLYRNRGWHEDSRRVLSSALELTPDFIPFLLDKGISLERLGYWNEAGIYLKKAARLYPGDSSLLLRLSDFERGRKNFTDAINYAEQALKIDRFNKNIYFRLHDLSRQMRLYDRSMKYLDEMELFSPQNAFLHRKKGDLYYELMMPEKALESWETAHKLNPGDTYITERIAFLKIEEKDITLSFLPSEETIMEAVRASLDFEAHAGAESLLVYDHAACRINSDGSSIWVVTEVTRALNDAGRDAMINVFLPFGGRKKILNAYSLNSDLRKSEASSISSYDIRFRQLRSGDFTVVQYVHYKPAPLYLENNFFGQWYIQSPYQHVVYSEWNIIYPDGKELKIDVASNRVKESKRKLEDGLVVHTFTAENIEPLIDEYYAPPIQDYLDTISVSTVKSWDHYVSWERALLRDVFVLSGEIKRKYKKLTEKDSTVVEKIESVFAFVAQDIRYQQEYDSIIAGVKPHTAAQTLERGYGDCKDKAVLFIQLLSAGGIKAKYSVVRTTDAGKLLVDIPGQQFNHAIVYIPPQEGVEEGFFMDPTVDLLEMGNLRSDNQGALALVLDHKTGNYEFIKVPYQTPEHNFQKHDRKLSFDEKGGLVLKDTITLRGGVSSMLRQVLRTKEVGHNMFQNLAGALYKGGVLKSYDNSDINDIQNPLIVDLKADVNSLKTRQNGKITISLPDHIVNSDLVALNERKLPLSTGVPSIYQVKTTFTVPDGMKVASVPQPVDEKYDCFEVSRKAEVEGNIVTVKSFFRKECTIIPVDEYPAFREKIMNVIKAQNAFIVLVEE